MNLGKTVINAGGNMTFNNSALTFNAGTSTVFLTQSCTLSVSNEPVLSFYRFGFNNFAGSGTYVILDNAGASSIKVTNELYYGGSGNITVNGGRLKVLGNIIIANEASTITNGGTTIIELTGTGNQLFTGNTLEFRSVLSPVVINKTGGSVQLQNIISFGGGLTQTAGTLAYDNTSIVCFINTQTINLTSAIRDLQFSVGTYTIPGAINVKGNFLTRGSAGNVEINGTLNCEGEVRSGNAFITTNAGTGKIVLMGTGNQDLIGQGIAGTGRLCDIEINKLSGTVFLQSTISVMGNWKVVNGTIDPGQSSVWLYQRTATTTNIDMVSGASSQQSFENIGIGAGTLNLTTALVATKNLTINSPTATTLNAAGFAISVGGDWINNGTFTPGAAGQTVTFNANAPTIVNTSAASQAFNNLVINKSRVIAVALNKPVTVNGTLTLTQGYLATSSTSLLTLVAAATVSGGSNSAFISGPVSKATSASFTFPLGSPLGITNNYHPLTVSAPTPSGSNTFVAEYIAAPQAIGTATAAAILWVNNCDYWTIQRTAGTGTARVTPNWNSNCPMPTALSNLVVAGWNGTQWANLGQAANSATGTTTTGSIRSNSTLTISGTTVIPIALGSTVAINSPSAFTHIQLQQDLDGSLYYTNGNVLYFQYEEEYKDQNGFLNYRIVNLATNATVALLSGPTTTNVPVIYGTNFYQMDLLTAASTPLANGFYMLEVTNDKNEVFRARFQKN
jgi:hypothetical protein